MKWVFVEAAKEVTVNYPRYEQRQVSRLYQRLQERQGHRKAMGAVAAPLGRIPPSTCFRASSPIPDPAAKAGGAREV